MKGTILLNHTENLHQVEEEEKLRFLHDILEQMTLPIDGFWTSETQLSPDQRRQLRALLNTYKVQIIDDGDGGMKVYVADDNGQDTLVAEWHKSTYKLKRDYKQRDRRKQLYLEMSVSCWSLFEDDNLTEPSSE